MRNKIDPKMLELLDFLFCERFTDFEGEYRWGHEIGEIFIYVKHIIGTPHVIGYMNEEDKVGYNIYGQLDLLEYVWASGFNKGKYGTIQHS